MTAELEGLSDVANASVPRAPDHADVGVVGVEDLHLQPHAGELDDYKVTGDDLVSAAEVLPATPQHYVPLEHLHLDPELSPLVGIEADDVDRPLLHHRPLVGELEDYKVAADRSLLHHRPEFTWGDEHGDVFLVTGLHVEPDRFPCTLFVSGPRPPASA